MAQYNQHLAISLKSHWIWDKEDLYEHEKKNLSHKQEESLADFRLLQSNIQRERMVKQCQPSVNNLLIMQVQV